MDPAAMVSQGPTPQQASRYWSAFAGSIAFLFALAVWWNYASGQDHVASIPLNGDGTWYHNYEIAFEIQDQEILYNDIGNSIRNAQQADIIFLGWSRLIFAIDWREFEAFERKHHVKMFKMGMAGVSSGEFPLRIIRKYGLHPKLWIINTDRDTQDFRSGFFFMNMFSPAAFGAGVVSRVVNTSRIVALKIVLARNVRWRLKMAAGFLKQDPYRSARTGNWYLDNWPGNAYDRNPAINSRELRIVEGVARQTERLDFTCPAAPEEVDGAKDYAKAIGGAIILIQVPSTFACPQRVHELAWALGVPTFTVDPTQFSTTDNGGHLDTISARRYSSMLFAWLEQLPEFQRLFPK
jgi:hypothetical protein